MFGFFQLLTSINPKRDFFWVRVKNSFGHLSAGVRYVLIHFDVFGHCPKRMNLDLGSNI